MICFGRTKADFINLATRHYLKLISPFVSLSVQELKEQKAKPIHHSLKVEAERLFKTTQRYYLLDVEGMEFSSIGFADLVKQGLANEKTIDFVIGGAFGVCQEVKQKAIKLISLSRMTFPHDIVKVLLLEQIYRAFTIINNKEYHY